MVVIPEMAKLVYDAENEEKLIDILRELTVQKRTEMNRLICEKYRPLTVENMVKELMNHLYEVVD